MAHTKEQIMTQVVSRDGTEIGYWTSGGGPPLLLVHGAIGDHTRWGKLLPYLEPHVTVHAMDRRGRGASGDHPDWTIERECEDVAAVVNAVAKASGSSVAVYGHSAGGHYAFSAAALTSNIDRLVLYEGWPPVNPDAVSPPVKFVEQLEALLAEGKGEAVVETFLRKVVKMTEEELDAYRAHPSWPERVAAAPTLPRELSAFREATFSPKQAAQITVPTLLLIGSEGPDWQAETVAAALPDARVTVLDGQGHTADIVAPELVAEQLLAFLREWPRSAR
jgi:pimeloyl-ACP methyl ester carboxylesterase